MEVIIQGSISALGYLEDGVYHPEPDCYETIRDLIRYLRNDSETLLARKICGERNIIENDLIPLMKSEKLSDKMFDITLRLMANLVQPAIVSLHGKQPEDKEQWQTYWALEQNLARSKLAFADQTFFVIMGNRLEKYFMHTEWDDRTEEQKLVMERIIVLLRYIFSISTTAIDGKRTTMESNSHDRIIMAFLDSKIDEVLLFVASQSKERDFHLSILEIIALVVKEHKPVDIISSLEGRSAEEKAKAEEELKQAVELEVQKEFDKRQQILSSRHSRFAGSYTVKGLKAVNRENDFVVNKAIKNVSQLTFLDERKKKKVVAKNRRPFEASQQTHMASLELRMKMKQFAENVLAKSFNRMMKSTRESAFGNRRSVGQRNADMHYFLVMRFFLEYTRVAKQSTEPVSSCVGVETFHFTQLKLDEYLEIAATQRKEAKTYGMRAQYALSAYKELILVHQFMMDSGTMEEKELAQRTCSHIMNVEEYRELGCNLMRRFMPGAFSKTFLRELVLATHYYFKLLERSVKSGELRTVKKKTKIRRKTGKGKKKADESSRKTIRPKAVDSLSEADVDERWSYVSDELSQLLLGYEEASEDQIPINSLLDVSDEDHQRFCMLNIQRALREDRVADAVGLYRAAREVWMTEDIFGNNNMTPEEEFMEIREVYFADLSEVSATLLTAEMASEERFRGNSMLDGEDEEAYNSEDEDDEEDRYDVKEIEFDFQSYVVKFARSDVLKWYVFLLKDFETNSVELNKALVKMLHRITFDLNMPSRLYQLSLFIVFNQVNKKLSTLSKEALKRSPLYELYTFGFHLLKRFFASFETLGNKLAPEILFWKGLKESFEIEHGYGSYEKDKQKSSEDNQTWPEELEDEVRGLHGEYLDMNERPDGIDVVDFIEHNLSRSRTRKQVLKKMKELGLDALGAKQNKGSLMDRRFPLIDMKAFIEEFNRMEGSEMNDMVDFLRAKLSTKHGEFTRQKIIKQLTYLGINYSKPGKEKSSKKSKWSEGLLTELAALKQQYDEMDADDHALIGLVDYVTRRLSEKKARRQIERELVDLGASIEIRAKTPTKKRSKMKKSTILRESDEEQEEMQESEEKSAHESNDEDDDNLSLVESSGDEKNNDTLPAKKVNRVLVDSDDELGDMGETRIEEEETVEKKKKSRAIVSDDEEEADNQLASFMKSQKSNISVINDENIDPTTEDASRSSLGDSREQSIKSPKRSPARSFSSAAMKRRRIVDSSDEEDNQTNDAPESDDAIPEAKTVDDVTSPLRKVKKARVILSDSEED